MNNDRRWMKEFRGIIIAIIGVTLISQMFLGKVKDENLYERKQDNDTFESRNRNVNK